MPAPVTLDGRSLSIQDVVAVARHGASVSIAPRALDAVRASRRTVEAAIAGGATIYGVTTGFGKLAHVRIPPASCSSTLSAAMRPGWAILCPRRPCER